MKATVTIDTTGLHVHLTEVTALQACSAAVRLEDALEDALSRLAHCAGGTSYQYLVALHEATHEAVNQYNRREQ